MSAQGHHEAMHSPIPREAMHRIADIDAGFAPREQARLEDEMRAEGALFAVWKVVAVVLAVALFGFAYGATTVLMPILIAVTK